MSELTRPRTIRPHVPRFWGGPPKHDPSPDAVLDWEWVRELIESEPIYWLATAGAGRYPQARPLWGVWIDDMLNVGTGSPRQKRDLELNDKVTVHLPSGANVVIIEGRFTRRHDPELKIRAAEAYNRKYDWNLKVTGEGNIGLVEPSTIIAWTDEGQAVVGKGAPKKAGKWTFSPARA